MVAGPAAGDLRHARYQGLRFAPDAKGLAFGPLDAVTANDSGNMALRAASPGAGARLDGDAHRRFAATRR
jgi:hypothetical protein